MIFNRRKYIFPNFFFLIHSQNKRPIRKQLESSSNEYIEFSKEEGEGDEEIGDNTNNNTTNANQFNFLQQKRNPSLTKQDEIPLQLHDSDKEEEKVVQKEADNDNNINDYIDHTIEGEEIISNPEESERNESESSKDINFQSIIRDKINQIKEIKDHQRKCLLQENEDNLYGKNKAPKDMLNDIYQLISENANKAEDSESENEEMLTRWENEQYKSGVNTNKIKAEHNQIEIDESKDNIYETFTKIRNKMIDIDANSILSSVQSKLLKDEGDLDYYRKKKIYYQDEIQNIRNTEDIMKDKIEFYIDQYYKFKDLFCTLLQNEDSDVQQGNNDDEKYYLSS